MTERESMEFDVVIVGAGPAGLSASIRLMQLAKEQSQEINVCIVDKAAEIGGHILAGAVLEPRALNELIPDWKEKNAPLNTPVTSDMFLMLSKEKALKLITPPPMRNHNNYVISLGEFTRWLGAQAESLGVQIFPGFPAADILYNDEGAVAGILTGEFGRSESGEEKSGFQPAMELRAPITLFAEGCRGSLGRQLEEKFSLRENSGPQTYGLGIKELWEIDPNKHYPGAVVHTIGWPLERDTYGGAFLYHMENNQVAVGFVVGLDYTNPNLSPFEEFQRFKTHPHISQFLEGGKRISYGARSLTEGGFQSIPKLTFPGGALIGCNAGFMNVPKVKGTHTAMKSGMLAAEAAFEAFTKKDPSSLDLFEKNIKDSWIYKELFRVRNIRPSFKKGLLRGLAYSALDTYLLRGKAPWTFKHQADHTSLTLAAKSKPITYPKPDGKLTFDLLSSVYLSSTNHTEDQPCHLTLKNNATPIDINLAQYNAPEIRYCPAGVYEITKDADGNNKLQINAQNCLHCKTCDIKDPTQNIIWKTPEGGGGPNYPNM